MKSLWVAGLAVAVASTAFAQSTIYKHVDASGRVTYSNKPMKDAVVVELEPLTTIPSTPLGTLQPQKSANAASAQGVANVSEKVEPTAELKPAVAIVTPLPQTLASARVDAPTQKRRDESRRRILSEELDREEQMLAEARRLLSNEQQNPELVAAVRLAQQAADPTPSQQVEFRKNIEKASGRIRGLQATVAEHEKNIEALKKELGALKP